MPLAPYTMEPVTANTAQLDLSLPARPNFIDTIQVETIEHPIASSFIRETTITSQASSSATTESDDELGYVQLPTFDQESRPALQYSTLSTGLCYDARMRFHCELDPPKDRSNYHPEDPRRIYHIYYTLCNAGLVEDPLTPQGVLVKNPLARIWARHVLKDEVLLVHEGGHYDFMQRTKCAWSNPS